MRADDTIHFNNPRTHPDVVYAPMHLVRDPGAHVLYILLAIALALLIGAGWSWSSEQRRAARDLFIIAVITALGGIICNVMIGSHIRPLPDQTHFLATSTDGDATDVYVTRAEALAAAERTSEDQGISPLSARAVAYPWGKWPLPKSGDAETKPPYTGNTFPTDAGWSDADLSKLDAWVKKVYGASPHQDPNRDPAHFNPALPDWDDANDTATDADNLTIRNGDSNAEYKCMVEMKNVTYNELSEALTAVPKRLVCANFYNNYDTNTLIYPLTLAQKNSGDKY